MSYEENPNDLGEKPHISDVVKATCETADKLSELLDGQEFMVAIVSLCLVLRRALPNVAVNCMEHIDSNPVAVPVASLSMSLHKDLSKMVAMLPALRIGDEYMEQIKDFFGLDGDGNKEINVPEGEELDELMSKLFNGDSDLGGAQK